MEDGLAVMAMLETLTVAVALAVPPDPVAIAV